MTNRLANETSPYLLQHQHNPVDWYPWGDEALARAKSENKPILLSVGYSACHWCHVMERESFEDHDTATLMNRDFVNIKVDREERPDIDEIYMRAVQAFTGGHGGWPMTVFLLPDGKPFLGGTYFPPEPGRGMPSFKQMMARAKEIFEKQRPLLERLTEEVLEAVRGSEAMPKPADALETSWLEPLVEAAEQDFDERWGGFGRAPKFPPHGLLGALLAHHRTVGDPRSLEMVTRTLDAMARGGMYDLLGGGFARYSVDERWLIPHFEKMLYDNAQLVPVYLDGHLITGEQSWAKIARETLDWARREMTHPLGGFFSAQDADSEGVEGKFFVFTADQLVEILGVEDGARAAALFDVTREGTFEHGTSVLRFRKERRELKADELAFYERVRPRLFEAREKRVHPGLDDKIIAGWNGLMISAFARAAAVLGDREYLTAAERAARFVWEKMIAGKRLMRTWKNERARHLGCLDDHVLYAQSLVDLYEASLDIEHLQRAVELVDRTVELFWDKDEGGLFFTGHDAEHLVARSKNLFGGAIPSANGIAALLFVRLESLAGRRDLGEKAERILRSYQLLLRRAPRALGPEPLAGAWLTGTGLEIGIVGKMDDPRTRALIAEVNRRFLPFRVLAQVAPGESTSLLPWMEGRDAIGGAPTAYLCKKRACRAPITALEEWKKELDRALEPEAQGDLGRARVHAPALPADPSLWLNVDQPLSLEALRGRVVVLDFWTYCCINCMHVLPELAAVERAFSGDPVTVIGVHAAKFPAEKEAENVHRAVERHGVRHPVVLDSEHKLWNEYAIRSWPTVVAVDARGRVAWQKQGEVERTELERVVRRLLDEAKREGTLAGGTMPLREKKMPEGPLAFPGKIHVWPEAQAQSLGQDPFTANARVYIADSGHNRILEASIARDHDGWPRLKLERTFGSGVGALIDGAANKAAFRGPQGLSRFEETLWIADTENHAVRAIDLPTGEVRTIAGTGELGRGGRGNPAKPKQVALRSPWDIATLAGGVFVAMAGTHQIWAYVPASDRIGPMIGTGEESHVDGPVAQAALAQPSGLALFGHLLFFADSETSSIRVVDLQEHTVGTVVGRGLFDFGDVDGTGEEVRMQHPLGIAVTSSKIYVADTFNDKVKLIDLTNGATSTLAGGGREVLSEPGGLALCGEFLLVADTGNHRLRAIHRETGEVRDVPLV